MAMEDLRRYSASDPANPRFQAFATLEEDELTLLIRTKLPNGQRSTVLHGAEQFKKILVHFAGRFRSIRGSWSYDDNLATFNRAVLAGASPEEAALKTWTGQQAAAAGYGRAVIRSVEGQPGNYTKVVASFLRP